MGQKRGGEDVLFKRDGFSDVLGGVFWSVRFCIGMGGGLVFWDILEKVGIWQKFWK